MFLKASFIFCLVVTVTAYTRTHYKAAIYEHAVYSSSAGLSNRVEALDTADKNLDVLDVQVEISAGKGVDIFVFPEYGITGFLSTRTEALYFSEVYKDPNEDCYQRQQLDSDDTHIQARLSSIAKKYKIYLVVNIIDRQPCSHSNSECPLNGNYLYNTDVVFDTNGCLVARYHKEHLFLVEQLILDKPKMVEYSYFNTVFARFGLMICFDAVFEYPAIALVEKYNVTDIIFSTAWMNVYPHYLSTAYHSGWANTMNVNYLASNIHDVTNRYVGSGIYGADGVIGYTFNLTSSAGQLVIADVPINTKTALPPQPDPVKMTSVSAQADFTSHVFGDNFLFVKFESLSGNKSICSNGVCCMAEYIRNNDTEVYALGVFSGMHFLEGRYNLEVCLVVRCVDNKISKCNGQTNSVETEFSHLVLQGEMVTKYAFPELVNVERNFTKTWQFYDYGTTKVIYLNEPQKVLSMVLMGRNFELDPPYKYMSAPQVKPVHGVASYISVSGIFVLSSILLISI